MAEKKEPGRTSKAGPSDPYLSELDASLEDLREDPKPLGPSGDLDLASSETVIIKDPSLKKSPAMSKPLAGDLLNLAPDVEVGLVAVIGRKRLSVKDLLLMRTGQVLDLDRGLHEAIDLSVNGKVIARGELVDLEGRVGIKILQVLPGEGQ